TLMSLIHDKDFKQNLETHLFPKLKLVIQVGNEAVHSKTTLPQRDALQAVKELHHVLYWFIRTYTPAFANRELNRNQFVVQPFDEALIPQQVSIDATVATKALSSIKRVKELEKQLEQDDKVEREAYLQQLKE
ncbi:restriction endonuclease subunit R, partial [Vibrio sp. 10N.222.55.E8]